MAFEAAPDTGPIVLYGADGRAPLSGAEARVDLPEAQLNAAPLLSGLDGDVAAFTEDGAAVRLDFGADALVDDATANTYQVKILATGFFGPNVGEEVPDGSGRMFVSELPGRVRILDPQTGISTTFLDVIAETGSGGEQGFSGFALAPDFATSGTFYVFMTNLEGDNELRRYQTMPGNPDVADPASMDVIMKISHPAILHNGGWISFGPDGYLYVGTGDGQLQASDAQDPNSINGKILRIDVSGDDFSDDPLRDYAIPAGNPFASGGGLGEIWAMGLRNPFRNSFDPVTGNLYIGDVGGGVAEEINLIRPGEGGLNFGWPNREGTSGIEPDSPDYTPPVLAFPHPPGSTAIVGGLVYHGPIEVLEGLYIFGDVYGLPGRGSFYAVPSDSLVQGSTVGPESFLNLNAAFAPDEGANPLLLSFRQDSAGNLYFSNFGDGRIVQVSQGTTPSFAGGSLTVAITQNLVASEDRLLIDTAGTGITLSNGTNFGSEVRVDGRLIGLIGQNGSGVSGQNLIIQFSTGATFDRVGTLIHALSYANSNSGNPSTADRTITYTLVDGAGIAGGGLDTVTASSVVTVTAVDDLPVGADDLLSTDEQTIVTGNLFGNNGNGLDLDPDSPLSIVAVNGSAIAVGVEFTLASGALLTVNADGSFSYDPNHAFDSLAAAGSGASNSSAQETFTYTLAGDVTATVTINVAGLTNASNMLLGTAGADTLNGTLVDPVSGNPATDVLAGGAGDDIYYVDGADQVVEAADEGYDTVYAASNFALGAGQSVEVLLGSGSGAIDLTGNELANAIGGTAGANMLDGGAGNDYLVGYAGDDRLIGGDGDDRLLGDEGDDRLEGGAGNDQLTGGAGADLLIGGAGDDTYVVDSDDTVIEDANGGYDTVYARSSFVLGAGQSVELLLGSGSGPINLTGNELANVIGGTEEANVIDGGAGNDYLVGYGGDDLLIGGDGNDTLIGGDGNDRLDGGLGIDRLEGGAGNDQLIGGVGSNVLIGGAGDDVYVVGTGDTVVEDADGGYDTVYATSSFVLGAGQQVELLLGSGTGLINLTGNELTNVMGGTDSANVLDGGAGSDYLVGYGGNDILIGGDGDDMLYGDDGNDLLDGGSGNDRLVGGAGANLLIGGSGDDTYVVGTGDLVIEEEDGGYDIVYASSSFALGARQHIELLLGSGSGAMDLTGNELANVIGGTDGANIIDGGDGNDYLVGYGGNDTLIGGGGANTLIGGTGDDTYVVNTADAVFEEADGGFDLVYAASSFTLGAGQHVELLLGSGSGPINLTGNELANAIGGTADANVIDGLAGNDYLVGYGGDDRLIGGDGDDILLGDDGNDRLEGGAGNDQLTGGAGADVLIGGLGDDTYVVATGDSVIEDANGGYDIVYARSSFALGAGQHVELLLGSGSGLIDLTGNELANVIGGTADANVIDGGAGSDYLVGYAGADTFRFSSALDAVNNVDRIADFEAGADKIALARSVFAALDAGALSASAFATGSATTEAHRIIYNSASGALFYDADGSGAGAAVQFAVVQPALNLGATDFVVV